jgi:hypothetical protein
MMTRPIPTATSKIILIPLLILTSATKMMVIWVATAEIMLIPTAMTKIIPILTAMTLKNQPLKARSYPKRKQD